MADTIGEKEAVAAVERLLGARIDAVERPGGRDRRSVRLSLDGRSVIATRRKRSNRAELEMQVLRALRAQGAPVPEILAYDGEWLVQEDLGGLRLSQALAGAKPREAEAWLDRAIESLAAIQRAGRAAGLERRVARIGRGPGWLETLIATPGRIGVHLGIPAPALPEARLLERLAPGPPWFVKWDARPGNAVARDDGALAWFDWEHCGCRNRLDDLIWLLGDEYVALGPAMEERLLRRHLGAFCEPGAEDEARGYLELFGSFHACVRLALIVENKEGGAWWDAEACLAADKVGVTAECCAGLCAKAARWAARAPATEPLVSWFAALDERLSAPA